MSKQTRIDPKALATLTHLCGIVSDELRWEILWSLAQGPRQATFFAKEHRRSRTSVSNHLKVLLAAGLVRAEKESRHRIYSLSEQVRAIHHKDQCELVVQAANDVEMRVTRPQPHPKTVMPRS